MNCTLCKLHQNCKSINIDGIGNGDIIFIGDKPCAESDYKGIGFSGAQGNFIKNVVSQLNIDSSRIVFTHAVRCYTREDNPTVSQTKTCSAAHLQRELRNLNYSILIPLGNAALNALRNLGLLNTFGTISSLQGVVINENTHLVLPMVSPEYVVSNPHSAELYVNYANTLEDIVVNGYKEPKAVDYNYSDCIDDLKEAIHYATEVGLVSYDIETSTLHPNESEEARIISFALSWKTHQGFAFYLTEDNCVEAISLLHDRLLENPNVKKVIQHAKFELLWSMFYGRTIINIADTMLMHWHIDEKKGTHGLGRLAANFTDMGFYDQELEEYKNNHKEADPGKYYKDPITKEKKKGSYANIPPEILLPYNCADTDSALRVYKFFLTQLSSKQLWIVENIQIPSCYPLADMELRGVRVDLKYLDHLNETLPKQAKEIADKILQFEEVKLLDLELKVQGKDGMNFNSPPQLSTLLFDKLKLKPVYFTEKGKPSTDKLVLDYLSNFHEVPKLIRERRILTTLHSTFVEGLIEQKKGEFVHTSYGMVHTETGRYNSSNPNLQNIPRDALIKNIYLPDEDQLMLQLDYSQIELRVMAIYSDDKNLLHAFRTGQDVHRLVASRIYKKDPEEISKEERVRAKRIVFGLNYGQGAHGLAEELGVSFEEAEDFLNKFFKEFPGVKKWISKTQDLASQQGFVENMFGRIRRLPDAMIPDKQNNYRKRAMRQIINMPIQGTAADILALQMSRLYNFMKEENLKSRMLLTVHDSIVFSVDKNEANFLLPAAKLIMESVDLDWINIPIVCDLEIGKSWGNLKSISQETLKELELGNTTVEEILKEYEKEE